MPDHVTGERLISLFRPRSVALVGASDKSAFSQIAYHNLVQFGFREHTHLVSRRGTPTHGQPTVTSCTQIGEPVDVAYLMVPQAGLLEALDDAAAAGIRNACVLSSGYAEAGEAEDMRITAGAAAALGRLGRTGLGIVSISGGACDIVADRADDLGADLPELAPSTRDALAAIMPPYGTVQNPLDVTGAAIIDPAIFTRAIEAMSADPSIGVIGVVNSIPWIDTGLPYAGQMFVDAIGAGMRAASCPTAYVNQVMQPVTGYTRASMEQGGVSHVIPGLRQAVVALRNVGWWSEATRTAGAATPPAPVPGQPAAGGRRPDRGARRRPHLEGAQLMRTAFTDLVGVPHPIVGFNRSPGVVAAVTNAGGFGVLGASAYTPAELDAQLTWIDEQTGGKPYGVDLLVPEKFATGDPGDLVASLRAQIPDEHLAFVRDLLDRYGVPEVAGNPEHDEIAASLNPDGAAPLLDVAFRHPIRLIANALGPPPAGLVDRARQQGVPVAALVGQLKHAVRQIEAGVDLLIAQGTEAGGHTGTIATMVLTPEIVDIAAGRPVLAAGGIASGRQMAAALALGAAGVWCGSVWLSSEEDVANQAIKAKFLRATSSDTLRSPTRTGKPARQLRSAWHEEWERPGSPAPLPLPLQPMLVNEAWQRIDAAARTGHEGALRLESFFVGQVVGSFEQIRPAGEITRQIVADCEQQIRNLAKLTGDS